MRIVIDLQGAQSRASRNRGVGRYSLALAQGILRNKGSHEVLLALNGAFPESVESIREDFRGLIEPRDMRVWRPVGSAAHGARENDWARRSSEALREAFLARLHPDVILVSSLFEGLGDDAVTSIDRFARRCPTAAVLYDLIPLIHQEPYLSNPLVRAWYEDKLEDLRRADLLLAISDSSRREGIEHLGIEDDRIASISTAADPKFRPMRVGSNQETAIRSRFALDRAFVMYTGGIDHRKNIEGLIGAYARLPSDLRSLHQLAVVCAIQEADRMRLRSLAAEHGLADDELVFTGYVSEDDLLILYNLCEAFVFPSWHEGFGLPALEAMACGRAVIASDRSSLPEVIGHPDALFDPYDEQDIADRMYRVLTDADFRRALQAHGQARAARFSWDATATAAIAALERCARRADEHGGTVELAPDGVRPRLAFVSPLPPERSGIADYSADLVPELARFYDIEVIVAQDVVAAPWIESNCQRRSVEWFRANAARYDRVLYHFGNSSFHQHMFPLLEKIPGVVVLHDFYLSGIIAHMECSGLQPGLWVESLYASHGYEAVRERYSEPDMAQVIWKYPCNLEVLQGAHGIIVHSEYSQSLAQEWYGDDVARGWRVIPLLRVPSDGSPDRRVACRTELDLGPDQFVVCSFGLIGQTKLSHRLLRSWLASPLARDESCVLVFVGENDSGEYGRELQRAIAESGLEDRIRITGWVDAAGFRAYLHAADVGVQLRTLSRGETSAAVLDCMNHGLATIVNANGSMGDLPNDGVLKIPDSFTDDQLMEALAILHRDVSRRETLGGRAREIIRTRHGPDACASRYADAIEAFYKDAGTSAKALVDRMAALALETDLPPTAAQLRDAAQAIDASIVPSPCPRQVLVDVSELVQRDSRSGIQRVVRAALHEWLRNTPPGYRIEPVYATEGEPGYRYARRFVLSSLGCPDNVLRDDPVSYRAGDHFIGLDLQPAVVPAQREYFRAMRRAGVDVRFVVYDLLPIHLPHCFFEGAAATMQAWLDVVGESDGVIAISRSVAQEFREWFERRGTPLPPAFKTDWFHLGADVQQAIPTVGLPANAEEVLATLRGAPTFLMVGTLEPRKGHGQVLDAFEALWADGHRVNLAIVGRQGWMVEKLADRIRSHPDNGIRLYWIEDASDEYLDRLYAAAACLVAASFGEGFGLPLIEAAQHGVPIIARDLPVFREVAGDHAFYFHAESSEALAGALEAWLRLYASGAHPSSHGMRWLTWRESAARLLEIVTAPVRGGVDSLVERTRMPES